MLDAFLAWLKAKPQTATGTDVRAWLELRVDGGAQSARVGCLRRQTIPSCACTASASARSGRASSRSSCHRKKRGSASSPGSMRPRGRRSTTRAFYERLRDRLGERSAQLD